MSGSNLHELPFVEVPENAPSPGENVSFDTVSHRHIEGADSGEYAVLKEEGRDGAYIASTVTVDEFEP